MKRPEHDEYFMKIAIAVRSRANCLGQRVGAVLVRDGRVIATGYNGVPEGMTNCEDGGCERCENRGRRHKSGTAYDVCICVHAEQNAMLSAARFGTAAEGAVLYTTTRPCFGCSKEILSAKITGVFYLHEWEHPNQKLHGEYKKIQAAIPRIKRLRMRDPDETWAKGNRVLTDTGHTAPVAPSPPKPVPAITKTSGRRAS
jgi:dCMP deaminase